MPMMEEHIKASLNSVGMEHGTNVLVPSLVGKSKGLLSHVCLLRIQISYLGWANDVGWMCREPRMNFMSFMHHSAHHHGKAVLMITHDPEEVMITQIAHSPGPTKICHGVVSMSMKVTRRWEHLISCLYDFMQSEHFCRYTRVSFLTQYLEPSSSCVDKVSWVIHWVTSAG